jgi:hypothetical protein
VSPLTTSAFDLPERLSHKSDPALIATDETHFAAIAESLEEAADDLSDRLDAARRAPAGGGQVALDRDLEVHRLTARLRALRRFGLDLCLGRIVAAAAAEPAYIGRLGLTDRGGRRLLLDWRSPAAEPFFGATHANPLGLTSRRRYRWSGGRVTDFWDEVFTDDGLADTAALDDQSAFIASLGSTRSSRMRDVLGTIAADQDAIIRAGSKGPLVVDGGPGTGKTVVALHRTAYLLYSDPRLGHRNGGVLFVGPHEPYLAYVSDVLPSLGEEGVQTCRLRDLVAEGAIAAPESDPAVARLKADARLASAVDPAVRLYEMPPTEGMAVVTASGDVWLGPRDWAEAFDAPEPGAAHNEAREHVWEALLAILVDKLRDEVDGDGDGWGDEDDTDDDGFDAEDDGFDAYGLGNEDAVARLRQSLSASLDLVEAFGRAWPLLDATDLVGDLWTVPAYLHRCAPWLTRDELMSLQREAPQAWTVQDLPLLDAMRKRLGDPEAARRHRRREAVAAERARMADVVSDLVATDDSEMHVMSMLRGQDLKAALVDEDAVPRTDPDLLAGPFAHVVVDEAQELTDAEWQMLLRRCPSRSLTIVGDRAQARHGFAPSWEERLAQVGLDRVRRASLSINYRTPAEVMAEAEPVIRAVLPDANVPMSVRHTGVPVVHGSVSDLRTIVDRWLDDHAEGVGCVIADPTFEPRSRMQSLTPELVKGLEFDFVVLVDPGDSGSGVEGAVDRYVAMTRATQELVVLTST